MTEGTSVCRPQLGQWVRLLPPLGNGEVPPTHSLTTGSGPALLEDSERLNSGSNMQLVQVRQTVPH